jgi:hypothetical protein
MEHFNLDNRPKLKAGFKTPDNYFESFTDRLMQQLPEQEVKVVPLYRRKPVWISAVAAVFVAIMGLALFFNVNTDTPVPDDTAIEDYLVYQTNMSTYDLMQNLDEQDIAELETSISISDEAIEDYLSNENIYINE